MVCAWIILVLLSKVGLADPQFVLDAKRHHLGIAGRPEWDEYANDPPEGRALELSFEGRGIPGAATLFIRQSNVKLDWKVRLNDRLVGRLLPLEVTLVHAIVLPPSAVREGKNVLVIEPPGESPPDDVVIDRIALDPRPLGAAVGRATLAIAVTDADSRAGLPCRITITDPSDALVPLAVETDSRLAARAGVVYTADGLARVGLLPGRITVSASRGFEYGVATQTLDLAEGATRSLDLAIRREVPTPGLVACDTHVHTLTFSGHGDATAGERVVTIAGEGIELPVASEHNVLADFDPIARRFGVRSFFTPVIGDEVTTPTGHFNAFPFPAGGTAPDHRLTDWPSLLGAIRSATMPGDAVVILNHPRDLHAGFRPFDPSQFNAITGAHRRGPIGTSAIEVINSGALQSDPMQLVRDWMALLNHGERVTAVGGSDSHDVARFIVGQGRTYVTCRDDDPAHIDIAEACRALRAGRAFVSLGLLATLTVDGQFQAGDIATGSGPAARIAVRVRGPSWSSVDRVELYCNGIKLREQATRDARSARRATDALVTWEIPRPRHDAYLVAVASGPGTSAPFWPIPRPYQPTSRRWKARVLGVTNPVYLDGDGDGAWTSPRGYAGQLIERAGIKPSSLVAALAPYDEAVAAQAAALCQAAGGDVRGPGLAQQLPAAAEPVRRGFAQFAATLSNELHPQTVPPPRTGGHE
jgi:hypothetical protein